MYIAFPRFTTRQIEVYSQSMYFFAHYSKQNNFTFLVLLSYRYYK